jgi:hypothetical protein
VAQLRKRPGRVGKGVLQLLGFKGEVGLDYGADPKNDPHGWNDGVRPRAPRAVRPAGHISDAVALIRRAR